MAALEVLVVLPLDHTFRRRTSDDGLGLGREHEVGECLAARRDTRGVRKWESQNVTISFSLEDDTVVSLVGKRVLARRLEF
jgi:hypothetical protein